METENNQKKDYDSLYREKLIKKLTDLLADGQIGLADAIKELREVFGSEVAAEFEKNLESLQSAAQE